MKYCKTCGLHYRTPLNHCLFCNNILEENALETSKPDSIPFAYPGVTKKDRSRDVYPTLFYFLLTVAVFCCVVIDLYSTPSSITWSAYVILPCLYVALLIHIFRKSTGIFHKVYCFGLDTLLFLVALALLGTNYHWALDYILPFGLILLNILATFCILGSKKRLYQYSIYIFSTCVLAVIPFFLAIVSLTTVHWPTLVCCLYSVVTLLGLFFFSTHEAREELRRRLHC